MKTSPKLFDWLLLIAIGLFVALTVYSLTTSTMVEPEKGAAGVGGITQPGSEL